MPHATSRRRKQDSIRFRENTGISSDTIKSSPTQLISMAPPSVLPSEYVYCGECSSLPPPSSVIAHNAKKIHGFDLEQGHMAAVDKSDHDGVLQVATATSSLSINKLEGALGLSVIEEEVIRSRLIITSGLCCYSEVPTIQKIVSSLPGIERVNVNVATKIAVVDHNSSVTTVYSIVDALNSQGFCANIQSAGGDEARKRSGEDIIETKEGDINASTQPQQDRFSMYIHWNVIFSGIFWIVSMLSFIGGPWQYCKYAGIISVFFGLPPVVKKAYRTVRRCAFDANCMMVIAAVGAALLGQYDEAASVSFLFSISEWLESRATLRARKALNSIVNLRPDRAHQIDTTACHDSCQHSQIIIGEQQQEDQQYDGAKNDSSDDATTNNNEGTNTDNNEVASLLASSYMNHRVTNISASSLAVHSLVCVRTGDKVPTDGVVIEGRGWLDNSSLTGEAHPVRKVPGDSVSGGSISIGSSPLIVKTTSTVEDSAVSRLVRLVEESQMNRSPTEILVDQFARSYTPIVLMLAINMCIIPWIIAGPEVGRKWVLNGLIIIVLACPCALTISTPVTYAAALAATAQHGVIIKGGASLEALGRVDKIVFDKTGTLTEGKFTMGNFKLVGDKYSKIQALQLLALMESTSSHPLASTLVHAAQIEGADIPSNVLVTDHTTLHGEGVTALLTFLGEKKNQSCSARQCYVGSQMLMQRVGMWSSLPQHVADEVQSWSSSGGTVVFLGLEGEGIMIAFCVLDSVRPEAKEVVTEFKDRFKFDITILTGDSAGAAHALAEQIGLNEDQVKAQLLPEGKLRIVRSMIKSEKIKTVGMCRSPGLLLFCGDGVNDAPSMSAADVSVAMGSGAALALETCDISLMDSNLKKLVYSIDMGRRVLWTIKENIAFALLAKLVVVVLTFASKTTLFIAIATDLGVMLLVTLNGMKLLPDRKELVFDFKECDTTENEESCKRRKQNIAYFKVQTEVALPEIS